jgi:hypothetical protein
VAVQLLMLWYGLISLQEKVSDDQIAQQMFQQ